ncbi:MAG TPA: hypothetical protein VGM98_20265 [Schlesneria sp.]|jgi:hypothetical protein
MSVTSSELLGTIASDRLSIRLLVEGDLFAIGHGMECVRIGMLHIGRPHAKVAQAGITVDVSPSSGLPDRFAISTERHEPCGTHRRVA